jgi:hypothetical protein
MENNALKVFIEGVSRVLIASAMLVGTPVAATADDLGDEFEALRVSDSATGQEWFDLAIKARSASNLDVARRALTNAADSGFAPVRVGIERSRQYIAADDGDSAVAELRNLFDQGFTAVGFFTGDPVINSLAGAREYDALLAEMSIQAFPCDHQDGFRDFDFWVGDWDVHLANGSPAGTNTITREERGCVVIERWLSAGGGTGMSINYLDKITGEWVQIWNASGGSQINIRGGLTEDGMAMEGTLHSVAAGTTVPFRALWTPLDDGRVRQYFEQSNDDGETWVPWFEGFYSRKQ